MYHLGKDNTVGAKSEPQNIIKTELDKIMSNIGFGLSGIATETTVVDSEGQRLVLRIDNNLGGGGQRRVTIYCPFWIVNTTEHALRYRQEGKSSYVSGTVSDGRDGSRAVDGSERNRKNNYASSGGTTSPRRRQVVEEQVTPPREKGIKFGGKRGKNKQKSLTLSSPTNLYKSPTPSSKSAKSHLRSGVRGIMASNAFHEAVAYDQRSSMIFSGKVRERKPRKTIHYLSQPKPRGSSFAHQRPALCGNAKVRA